MKKSDTFSFIQITDLHVGEGVVPDGRALESDLRQLIAENGASSDFIIATGDLTDLGKKEEFTEARRALSNCGMRVHTVVGDHDQRAGGPWEPNHLKPENYVETFGALNYSFLHKGVYFISYDCIFGNQEFEPSAWLVKELESLEKDRPIILLPHRPLTNVFFKTLKRFPIKACISGHWHSSRLFESQQIFHATCPSLSFGGIDFSPRSYRVFHWDGAELSAETFPLSKPASGVVNADPNLKTLWSSRLGGKTLLGSPIVSGEQILVASMKESGRGKGFLESFNLKTGAPNWKSELPTSVKNSPQLSGNNVIAVTVTGEVFAFDLASGKTKWTQSLGDPSERWVYSAPAIRNGRVFVGSAGWFSALDGETGKELWKLQLDKTQGWSDWISSPASPAVDETRVYVGFLWRGGSIAAADQKTGEVIWKSSSSDSPISPLVLDGEGSLFYNSNAGSLVSLNAATGEVLWRFPLGQGWSPAAPLPSGDRIFVSSGSGTCFAVDRKTGQKIWEWECSGNDLSAGHPYRRVGKAIFSSPRIFENRILVGGADGSLVLLDPKNGNVVRKAKLGQTIHATPAVLGKSFFLSIGENIHAFEWR